MLHGVEFKNWIPEHLPPSGQKTVAINTRCLSWRDAHVTITFSLSNLHGIGQLWG